MSDETKPASAALKTTDFRDLLAELHGGVLIDKINRALSEVALGVCYSDAKKPTGEVVLKMTLTPIGDSAQVAMAHSLSFVCPTARGKRSETETTETPLHVGKRGRLTAYPEKQDDFFATRDKANQE